MERDVIAMEIPNKDEKKISRELVIPGDPLDGDHLKPGTNTYRVGSVAYSAVLGFKNVRSDYVNVIPLSGRYAPQVDDFVIGCVISLGPTTWLIDINAPYPAPLHVNEVPWRVDFGDTASYIDIGEAVLVSVSSVDEIKKIQVGMKHRQTRKLRGGYIIEISPSKVPRIIGKSGSMINLIKTSTNTRMFVGQNGRIWLDGDTDGILKAMKAIELIEKYSHKYGLTDRIAHFLEGKKGEGAEKTEEVPPKTEKVPPKTEKVPPKIEEVPPKIEEVPPKTEEVPPRIGEGTSIEIPLIAPHETDGSEAPSLLEESSETKKNIDVEDAETL